MYLGSCQLDAAYLGSCKLDKIYLGMCEVLSGVTVLPVFQANVPDPVTGFMIDVAIGIGGLTEARAGALWAKDFEGVYQEFGATEPAWSGGRVVGAVGSRQVSWQYENGSPLPETPRLVHMPEATNTSLNNYAPVTQTITAPTGTHTCWLEGTGSVTLSGGLTGTVTDGSPVTGDPAGVDVLCTVSGTPDFVMFEDNAAPTAPIPTGATPETRPTCDMSFDAANHDDVEGTYLFDVYLSGDSNILDGFLSVVDGLATLTDGVNTVVAPKLYPDKLGLVYGPDGLRLNADGIWSAYAPYDGTLLSGALDLFRSAPVVQEAGELTRYSSSNQAIVDANMPSPPIYTWGLGLIVKTTTTNETFTIPCANLGTYNATINWGDGTPDSTITTFDDVDLGHQYAEPGSHLVSVTGDLPNVYFNNGGDKDKVISATLFNSGADSYNACFYGCNLVSVSGSPESSSVTNFTSCFRSNQLTAIPDGLFDNTPSVTSFYACFYENKLTAIPYGLFDNTPSVATFFGCFYDNQLTAIPDGLFDNTPSVTGFACFASCFRNNPDLTIVPANIFDNCTLATDYTNCFIGCNLTEQSTNNVLISLDTAGASNGTVHITGQTPTGAGATAKTNLESKGWTVTVTTP